MLQVTKYLFLQLICGHYLLSCYDVLVFPKYRPIGDLFVLKETLNFAERGCKLPLDIILTYEIEKFSLGNFSSHFFLKFYIFVYLEAIYEKFIAILSLLLHLVIFNWS